MTIININWNLYYLIPIIRKQYDNQKILTLDCLLKTINTETYSDVMIILQAINLNAQFIEKLKDVMKSNPVFIDKIIFCCKSPLTVYKVNISQYGCIKFVN